LFTMAGPDSVYMTLASCAKAAYYLLPTMPYCDRCDRSFGSQYALDMHIRDSSNHFCCGNNYPTLSRMQQHWSQSLNHAYCRRCDDHFDDRDELEDHYDRSHDFCSVCRRVFANIYGLKEHYRQSEQHHYCSPCDEHFDDTYELEDHYERSHHLCSVCRRVFANNYGLKEHYHEQHHYCSPCDRHFQNDNNLRQHLNSSTHRPRNTHCPAGCGSSFISNSALVLHLESGGCSSGINRNTVNRVVRQLDTNHVITDPSRLITGGTYVDDEVTYYATAFSWNGFAYECYLCHKDYSSLRSLNQHLASPAHERKFYICPGPNCDIRFVGLGALCQHIESESCGVLRFRAVQATMDSLLGQMTRLTF